jgi:hypothetical protein
MAHLARISLRGNFRRIDPAKTSIVQLEGGSADVCRVFVQESRQTT